MRNLSRISGFSRVIPKRYVIAWMHLMTAIAWITFGTTLGIVSPWLYLRIKNRPRSSAPPRPTQRTKTPKSGTKTTGRYAGVSLWPCLEACPAAWKLQGERFLAGQKPALPLADCDQAACDCRFREHDDRRADDDRRDNWGRFGGFSPQYGKSERRTGPNRRARPRND
jgi:hypothetical protein